MPEGPEVAHTTHWLNEMLSGQTLEKVQIIDKDWSTKQLRNESQAFLDALPLTIDSVECKGKFIYFTLGGGEWHIHHWLGMSGSWRKKTDWNCRMTFHTTNGNVIYRDPRKYGGFKFYQNKPELLTKKLDKDLGPDLLTSNITLEDFTKRLNGEHTRKGYGHRNITDVLMDQKAFAGIGNYLKAEILWKAQVSPHRQVSSLTSDEIERIHDASISIIAHAYASKGHSFRDYQAGDGKGKFRCVVYGKKKDPDGNAVIIEDTPDGRATHWVPTVQK